MEPIQLDLFDIEPTVLKLNGMYFEKSTDKFVSYVHGRRHYEEPAKRCQAPKDWQERIRRERVI